MKPAFSAKDSLAWAAEPSPAHEKSGFSGSAWESAIVGLAESGDARFIDVLRKHVASSAIRSERATAALNTPEPDAAA
jgi:hypothetical protein